MEAEMTKKLFATLAMALIFSVAAFASAPPAAWDINNNPAIAYNNNNWTFGNLFQVGSQAITVTDLGYYYDPSNSWMGANPSHDVAIFDAAGNIVAGVATVTLNNSFYMDHWRYTAITPVVLAANTQYLIEGVSGPDVYTYDDAVFTVNPAITYKGNNWAVNAGGIPFLGFGLINDVTDGYWGPNFIINGTTTPEPGTMALFGSGVLALFGTLRRRLQ
jgi:PEP-CTERM motif